MVDHILEIPILLVFGVKCFNCDTKKSYLGNNPAWNKDDILEIQINLCLFFFLEISNAGLTRMYSVCFFIFMITLEIIEKTFSM